MRRGLRAAAGRSSGWVGGVGHCRMARTGCLTSGGQRAVGALGGAANPDIEGGGGGGDLTSAKTRERRIERKTRQEQQCQPTSNAEW